MAITTFVPNIKPQTVSYTNNGFSTDTVGGVQFPLQKGVPFQNLYTFMVVPAEGSTTCVAGSQSYPSSGYYALNKNDTYFEGSDTLTITKAITFNGTSGVLFDCERSVSATFAGETTAEQTITITGYDYRGTALQFSYTVASGTSGTLVLLGNTISLITSIFISGNPGTSISFGNTSPGTTCAIGLPYFLLDVNMVVFARWGTTEINTQTACFPGYPWRETPPTTVQTGQPRGCVVLPSNPNGTTHLMVTYFVVGSDSEINNQIQNNIQSTNLLMNIQSNSKDQRVWSFLTDYDVIGMCYPGDVVAATAYNKLKNT